jgi:hypothetical protein
MKYNDKHTRLLQHKYDNREISSPQDIYRKKIVKEFSRKVLSLGIDPDWWELVHKDDKYMLHYNFRFLKNNNENDTTTLSQFISDNKQYIKIDEVKLRDIKLNKLIN